MWQTLNCWTMSVRKLVLMILLIISLPVNSRRQDNLDWDKLRPAGMEDRNLRRSISLKFYNILLDTGLLAKLYGLLMQLYAFFSWSNGNSGFFREKSVLLSGVFTSMDSAHRWTLVPYGTLPFLAWSLFALNLIWSGRKKPMFIHWKRQTHFRWMNEWGNTFPLTSIDLYVAEKENYKNSAKVRWDYFSNINESFLIQEGMEFSLVITKINNFRWRCSLPSFNASRCCGKRLSSSLLENILLLLYICVLATIRRQKISKISLSWSLDTKLWYL